MRKCIVAYDRIQYLKYTRATMRKRSTTFKFAKRAILKLDNHLNIITNEEIQLRSEMTQEGQCV